MADSLDLKQSGSGSMDLNLKAKTLRTELPGSGTILLRGAVDDQTADISGSGKIAGYDLAARRSEITISGSGVAERLSGSTICMGDPGEADPRRMARQSRSA